MRIANEHGAELVLVHSWYIPPATFAGDYVYAGDIVQAMSDDAQRALDNAVAEARKLGARRVTSKMLNGQPWQQIIDAAKREPGLGLIVIGTHGRTGLSRVLMGSVAELVVRHAPCPVLTIRPGNEPTPYTHVLCPVDFSACARHAAELAAQLVQPGGAVTLLHVLELPTRYGGAIPDGDTARALAPHAAGYLDDWAAKLRQRCPDIRIHSRVGSPGAQILAALEHDPTVDLVCMGSHGRTGLRHILLGSVAEKVVRHARCPVLVAHERG